MKRIAITLVFLLVTLFLFVGVTSSTPYDAWYDFDDDGDIDIYDIVDIAGRYGTTGTPINKTELLLELATRIDALNATLLSHLENHTCGTLNIVSDSFSGTTHASAGTLTVTFPASSFTQAPEIIYCRVVLKQAWGAFARGTVVYANIESITKDSFVIEVVEHKGSYTNVVATDVDVVYLAIGTESTSITQPNHCAETAVHYTTQFWTPPPASLNHNQIKVDFPVTFTNASDVELSASGIVVTGTCAGSPLRITAVNITTTYVILTLQGWNGSSWTNLGAGDEVEISYVVIEN